MKLNRAGSAKTVRVNADWFTGTVWQDPLIDAQAPGRVKGARVTFEPGARTNWHTHPLGQTLIVLSGLGRIQLDGEGVRTIRPGDSIWIAPGERHWHGASPDHGMVHLAVHEALDGVHVEWQEPVSDDDYQAAAGD